MEAAMGSFRQAAARRAAPEWALTCLFLAGSARFLFADVSVVPIVLWDESRNVVNALEMVRSGPGLVTTYGFAPDLWNTKPPLLIWLMGASVALFGPSEFALRLPSALAALGTILLTILFVRRAAGSFTLGLAAAAFLILSPGFFGEHGARTADYDALLLFFVTAYLQLLFFALRRGRPRLGAMLASGGMIAAAALTKSSAGLLPGAGVALWLAVSARWRRLSHWQPFAGMALAAALPVLVFYIAREAQAPGYWSAALRNDLVGRVVEPLSGGPGDPWYYYIRELVFGWPFAAGGFLLLVPFTLRRTSCRRRDLLLWSACVAGTHLLLLSLCGTKLLHYALPVYPALAVAAAVSVEAAWRRLAVAPPQALAAAVVVVLLLSGSIHRAVRMRYETFPQRQFYPQALYGELLSRLAAAGVRRLTVVDSGFVLEGRPHYVPLLRAYRLIWAERGLAVDHSTALRGSGLVASCEPKTAASLAALAPDVAGIRGCAAVRLARPGSPD